MQGGAAWVGGSEYIKNLIFALSSLPVAEQSRFELSLICGPSLDGATHSQVEQKLKRILYHTADAGIATRLRWRLLSTLLGRRNPGFTESLRKWRIDFLYPITYDNRYNIGVSLPLGAKNFPCRWAAWVPDFQHKYMPQLFSEVEIARRDHNISLLAGEAAQVVLSSRSAEADWRKFYPESAARPSVLSFCTSPHDEWYEGDPKVACGKYHLPERFFLVSNQFWLHKNHLLVFEALEILAKRSVFPIVVCTGQPHDFRDKNYFNLVLQKVHELGIARQVFLLGLIPRGKQIQIMRRALAVIQPSQFEGWSTVVEDARVLGKPIILSDIAVHQEQNPPGSRFFESQSAASCAAVLEEAWDVLQPGPDSERERLARSAGKAALQSLAATFMETALG
jgi:glycosyltransferase involved in cell wall biosynthesis